MRVQEVPVVPREIFAQLREYQNIRSAQFASWSPDGNAMLIHTRFGNASQLHRVAEPGGRREQLTFFDEPVAGARYLPAVPDSAGSEPAILFLMGSGGNENNQIYRLEPNAYRHRMLTDGKSRHQLGPINADGSLMVVHHNRRNGRDTDLYTVDTKTGDEKLLFETKSEFWQAEDWSQDGRLLAVSHYVSANESYPALFDLDTKNKTLLKLPRKEGQKIAIGEMKFSPDAKTLYLTHDGDGEFTQLYAYDLASAAMKPLTADIPWDVEGVTVDKQTGAVVFTINEEGYSKLYLLRAGERRPLELPQGIVGALRFSPDGTRLGLTWSSPASPADAYSYELATGKLTRWTMSEAGGLDPRTFLTPELIRFKSFDGREIPAFYYRPRAQEASAPARPVGVLISIHGGPESQYRPDFSGLAQFYAGRLGVAVVIPNVRGSAGYGKTYLALDNARLREDSVKDIGALLDWIGTRKELDPQRVAVSGGSYGGYMVLASLTHFGDRIRAGIDNVGIANWVTFLERTSPYRQDLRRAEYGDERDADMRKFLEEISPANRAEKITSALLVAHGVNDPRVPFSEAEQIAEKVRTAGKSVWTVYADNEGHGFAKKDNRDYLSGVEALFLSKFLK
ncbi:MAG: alpha/beta fold hydrolase [Planctomycetia bacterium]|nr:alpha/beta fold hydrolase [Planctomycetia bacterium]